MEEIDLKELFTFIKEKLWIVIMVLVITSCITVIYLFNFKKPVYKSSTTYILISNNVNQDFVQGITTTDLTLNEKLIETYKEVIKSRNILEKVIEKLDLQEETTTEKLANCVTVQQVSTSSMIKITVSYDNPNMAQKIASVIGEEFSNEIQNLYNMNNISMIDKPLVPASPSNSSNLKEIVVINGGGLVISLMIIFLIFYFDNTIKGAEQIEEKIKLPILGNVPTISKSKNRDKDIITYSDPKSSVSEGIRTIRTNLQFSNIDQDVKKIMVTSSMPGEGKSFISANLAIAFAQDGKKVLVIDCDLRKGRMHRIFEEGNGKGLSNLLIDDIEEKYKKYIKQTKVPNLSIITAGVVPPNPSELLNSEANKKLISILEKEYDYIIFDCVPINGLPDSLIMSNLVDKTILVSAMKETPIELLQQTTKSLQNVESNIAGIVVNKTNANHDKYYGHYYG